MHKATERAEAVVNGLSDKPVTAPVEYDRIFRDKARQHVRQFPHCDQRILHAPGECEYCDMHPEWQALRTCWGIAFTGFEPDGTELPDPATHARGKQSVNGWYGNVARPKA